jgi:hypothetical protein
MQRDDDQSQKCERALPIKTRADRINRIYMIFIESYIIGDGAPSPSIPLPEGEGRKLLLPRGEGWDEGATLIFIQMRNEFSKDQ